MSLQHWQGPRRIDLPVPHHFAVSQAERCAVLSHELLAHVPKQRIALAITLFRDAV